MVTQTKFDGYRLKIRLVIQKNDGLRSILTHGATLLKPQIV